MTRLLRSCTYLAVGLGLLLSLRPTNATTVVALSDVDLARGARTVLHGDVLSKESFVAVDGGRIYTEYRFAVRELMKGAAESDGSVLFREWGGEVGGTHYWIPGLNGYQPGEEVVAFLGDEDPRSRVGFTYGLAQGKFKVLRDSKAGGRAAVRRDLGGLKVVSPDRPTPAPAADEPAEGRDLEAFKVKIRAEAGK